jgi:hypothetical protein
LQVPKETGKVATSDKWIWVVRGGPPDRPAVLFDYDASRGEAVALRLFEGFLGVLQVDGCASYNRVCRENKLTWIGCWDHARRKFVEASQAMPTRKKGAKVSKADVALSKIRKLYAIEKRIESLSPEQKREQRQVLSLPILEAFKVWLEKNRCRVVKDSLIETAKANDIEPYDYLQYILKHIATADNVEKLEALLPWNMKSEKAQ